jgi:hypothetical protein
MGSTSPLVMAGPNLGKLTERLENQGRINLQSIYSRTILTEIKLRGNSCES